MFRKSGKSLTSRLKPLLPDLSQGYQIDIAVTRDVKGEKTKSKNSTWITIKRKIPPTSVVTLVSVVSSVAGIFFRVRLLYPW